MASASAAAVSAECAAERIGGDDWGRNSAGDDDNERRARSGRTLRGLGRKVGAHIETAFVISGKSPVAADSVAADSVALSGSVAVSVSVDTSVAKSSALCAK